MRTASRVFFVCVVSALVVLCGCKSTLQRQPDIAVAPVVFVCEHGNVKSLIGASLFDQVAKKRGLPFRSVSRAVTPEASVPLKIVEALRSDGVEVAGFKPQQLSSLDVARAARVIAIEVDLTAFSAETHAPIEVWADVPPASVDYAASRAALLRHIDALLKDLQTATPPANGKNNASTPALNTVEVKLTEYKIEMPTSVAAGATTFKVTNAGKETHGFEVEGNGLEKEIEPRLQKGGTGMLQVDLKPGTYKIYCPVDGHKTLGMSLSLTVK